MSDKIKFFSSSHFGAPTMNGNVGQMLGVLDACLIVGYNLKTLDSLTFAAGIATATISATHGYDKDAVVLIAGAAQSEYNGEQSITVLSTTVFTFPVTGTPVSPATGAITAKVAPLGWEKAFTGTNLAAYRSLNVTSNKLFLRVDDNNVARTDVWGAETMSDINTGTGVFPFTGSPTAFTPYMRWRKQGASADTVNTNKDWVLVGNDKTFFFLPIHSLVSTNNMRSVWGFGDFPSYKPGDAYNTLIAGPVSTTFVTATATDADGNYPGSTSNAVTSYPQSFTPGLFQQMYAARNWTGTGSFCDLRKSSVTVGGSGSLMSGSETGLGYPNPSDYSLIILPAYAVDKPVGMAASLRGLIPGLNYVANDYPSIADRTVMQSIAGPTTKKFLLLKVPQNGANIANGPGLMAVDLTGPW